MTLEKAIEIVEIGEQSDFQGITCNYEEAIGLLIEAGKRLQSLYEGVTFNRHIKLPGETEE